MIKKTFFLVFIISLSISAQPVSSHYYKLLQKDSLYYLLTDKALLKFYSHGASGEFYLTRYIEGNYNSSTEMMFNDDHLFIIKGDSVFFYSNSGAWDLTYENVFVPGYSFSSLHGFGPYFLIRSGNAFNILKIENGSVVPVLDSLFTYSSQGGLFFSYPLVVLGGPVYKFIEGFGFYAVGQIGGGSIVNNTGITNDTLITYLYWTDPGYPYAEHSILFKRVVEEPSFPSYIFENWGVGTYQLHCPYCLGTLIAKENLYYMTWVNMIVRKDGGPAYEAADSDNVAITDNYIFLLGDSVQFSRWNWGSHFFPFVLTNLTDVKDPANNISDFALYQNYPNPFNPTTRIKYRLAERSKVKLTVYDMLGREFTLLVNEEKPAGDYEIEFDGTGLPSGVYFYRIETGKYSDTKKFVLLK